MSRSSIYSWVMSLVSNQSKLRQYRWVMDLIDVLGGTAVQFESIFRPIPKYYSRGRLGHELEHGVYSHCTHCQSDLVLSADWLVQLDGV